MGVLIVNSLRMALPLWVAPLLGQVVLGCTEGGEKVSKPEPVIKPAVQIPPRFLLQVPS